MGNGIIAFLATVSAMAWLYGKFMRKTGNNAGSSVVAIVVVGILLFVVLFLLLNAFVPSAKS